MSQSRWIIKKRTNNIAKKSTFLLASYLIDRARGDLEKLCKRRFFFATHYYRVHVDPSWRHQQSREKSSICVKSHVFRLQITIFHPQPNFAAFVWLDILLTSFRRHTHSMEMTRVEEHVCAITCRLIIFFLLISISLARGDSDHICFFRWLHFECGKDIEFQFFPSYSGELACVWITRLIWWCRGVGEKEEENVN